MLARLLKIKTQDQGRDPKSVAAEAGRLFGRGHNCAQAVYRATTGRRDPDIHKLAKAFGGGIGDSKCLCGAVTGGVMALAINDRGARSGELVQAFRQEFKATCCAALSRSYEWKSREHLANCRRITERTAAIVAEMLAD